jgi:hypothetical protein
MVQRREVVVVAEGVVVVPVEENFRGVQGYRAQEQKMHSRGMLH